MKFYFIAGASLWYTYIVLISGQYRSLIKWQEVSISFELQPFMIAVHGGTIHISMSTTWRMAGLNYVNYSNIAARVLRKSLKSPEKDEASKRDVSHIKVYYWTDGQMLPAGEKPKGSGGEIAVKT